MRRTKVANVQTGDVFTMRDLRELFDWLRPGSLPREIKQGRLRAHRICGHYDFLGEDVLQWIRAAGRHGEPRRTLGNGSRVSGNLG
jgi:hypothetical protein